MSGILSFLVGCVALAICLMIGFMTLNFLFAALYFVGVTIFMGLSWIWKTLTKRDYPNEPRI